MGKQSALSIIVAEFTALSQVPRPSHHEEKASIYLAQWAKSHKLEAVRDELGNIIIDKPASTGCELAPKVILQAHMDMVCVAEDGVAFNPLHDPIRVSNDGKILTAEGTSLGADDGIGIAICLYVLQSDHIKHGPLRVIFTVNEEDGMSACDMDNGYLDGDYLINLDRELLGSLCNSSAGGDYYTFYRPAGWEAAAENGILFEIELTGLLGGHSGNSIHKGHANALVSIAMALGMLKQAGIDYRIAEFGDGQAKNAIPATARAAFLITEADYGKTQAVIDRFAHSFSRNFSQIEPEYKLRYGKLENRVERCLGKESTYGLVYLICLAPDGVHTMSPFVEGLVESSANLGLVSLHEKTVVCNLFARSSSAYYAAQFDVICRTLAAMCGFNVITDGHVPAWAINPRSRLTDIACWEYKRLTGYDMSVDPTHGGLECGAFAEKNPHLDIISIGPTLTDVHSPAEACDLESVRITSDLLVSILAELT